MPLQATAINTLASMVKELVACGGLDELLDLLNSELPDGSISAQVSKLLAMHAPTISMSCPVSAPHRVLFTSPAHLCIRKLLCRLWRL